MSVRALINGKPARSMDDLVPGAELSFDGEVRVGDVVLFGEERYRATRAEDGGVALEPIGDEQKEQSEGDDDDSAPPCPSCGSVDVLPYLYGEPMPGVKGSMLGMKPDDEVVIGGCLVDPENPVWKCRACGHDFGRLGDERPGMFE